ncbi:MAG TPA: divalent-cation tolerance protein CutA [Pirellulaceae bacterium]|nr:divalent-cation tolerance protein CutA [Pirellulaceae bacterium]
MSVPADDPIVLLMSTFPDEASANEASRRLVESRTVACAQIGATILSCYRWEGKLERSEERPLTCKTTESRLRDAIEMLRAAHPYVCPEIVVIRPSEVGRDYADWVRAETSRDEGSCG